MSKLAALMILAAACAAPLAAHAAAIPTGRGQQTADIDGTTLEVFTYRPPACTPAGILLVFHGLGRNVAGYRDYAIPAADRYCLLVVAPLFETARFPTWSYQRGGIVHDGKLLPPEQWTVALAPRLAAWARAQPGDAALPTAMIGHSAGGQFLSRVAAFAPNDATRMVIANPSTWVAPTLDVAAPYGLGGVYPPDQGEAALKRYLAAPITVLLGGDDVGAKELATGKEADAQGATRLARGQNIFRQAELTARQHGWPFNWTLAMVPGVGHSAREMIGSEQALAALKP